MYVKICLSALIIIGCGYVGILFGRIYSARTKQLDSLSTALGTLELSVAYMGKRLSDALGEIRCADKTIEKVFQNMSEHIARDKNIRAGDAWLIAAEENERELCLGEEDAEVMRVFTDALGCGDREREMGNIKAARLKLDLLYAEAKANAEKNARLCKNSGFLIGAMAALVLF